MSLKQKLNSDKFLVTVEVGPPKGISVDKLLQEAELIRGRVDAVNVTDLQSSVMRLGSLAVSSILKQKGFEPVLQLTCRDRNRLALQSDVLSAAVLGIENLLVLTGDHPTQGDHPQAKPVFDLDSVQLLSSIKKLQSGEDLAGNKLEGEAPKFCVGAVVNPGADPIEPQIIKMEQKMEAGAEFFQTQAIFDIKTFERFLSKTKHLKARIIAGIVMLKSERMAQFMNDNVAGVSVPQELIREIAQAQSKSEKSVEIASRFIRELKPLCHGVHIMPIGWNRFLPKVLDASGLP